MRNAGALETPLLRVSRPVAACSRCRTAKIKCDGKLPACTACEKTGRENECSSSNDQFAKGKERSYVSSLESRIEKLEKKLAFARLRKASVAMHDADEEPADAVDRKDSMATIRAAIHGKAARRREATDVNELVSDFGFLSVNATTRDFEAATTSMTFARLIISSSMNERMPPSKGEHLPSRPAAMALVQFYLDNVFALYPAFQETAIFNALDAIYHLGGRPVSEFEYWLLYMVLAIGAMGQSRSRKDTYYKDGVSWAARALKYADKVLVPGFVTQMQALVLLVQYSMLDPAHFDSWQLVGFACRAVVDLGYHQDPPKEQQPEKQVLDQRRKLFWCIYSLDRSISMVHARPFSFTDDATSVEFPTQSATALVSGIEGSLPGPNSVHAALLFFQLRLAQSTWYQDLFQSSTEELPVSSPYIWKMCHDMRSWAETFPKSLPAGIRGLFDLELLYSYVYCLAPSCRVPAVSDLGKTLIYEYSMQYVDMIFPISKDPVNTGFYTYHDALRVFFIGSQFLAVIRDNADRILSGVRPYSPTTQGGPPPPPIPNIGRHDNLERSIRCIEQILDVLEIYGDRWSDSRALQSNFRIQAEPVLHDLHNRKSLRISASSIHSQTSHGSQSSPGPAPSYSQSNHSHQLPSNQYQPHVGEWANMNQLLAGGGQMLQPGGTPQQNPLMYASTQGSSPQGSLSYSQGSSPQPSYGQGSTPQSYLQSSSPPPSQQSGQGLGQHQQRYQISPQGSYQGSQNGQQPQHYQFPNQ